MELINVKKVIYIMAILSSHFSMWGQKVPVPENYTIISKVMGDLDKDGVKELVVAYNTKTPEDELDNVARALIIYKLVNNKWSEWKKSEQALYGSADGGMMGDPFGSIEIKNGILLVMQQGGSSWKWEITDKYRFQNGNFYLIGYTSVSGKPCEYWDNIDFNLSTGKMLVKREYEKCNNHSEEKIYKIEKEILYKKGLKITLQTRDEKEIKIVTPKYHREIYIAMGT